MSVPLDLAIVGGGPAGAAAAIYGATNGYSVALFEAQSEANRTPRPGESLHPGFETIANTLGITAVALQPFTRHRGHWVKWNGKEAFHPFEADWSGFQIPRLELDRMLLARAREVGVKVYQPCRVTGASMNGRLTTSIGKFKAERIFDATGGRHWIARLLGIPIQRYSPRLLCSYGYVADHPGTPAPSLRAETNGWTWWAQVRPSCFAWTRLSFSGAAPGAPPQVVCQASRPRAEDVTWRALRHPAVGRFVALGDAAAVVDPASSHGVLRALTSGIMAVHAIRRPEAYEGWLRQWFVRDIGTLAGLYQRHPAPPRWAFETSRFSNTQEVLNGTYR